MNEQEIPRGQDPMVPALYRIHQRQKETDDTFTVLCYPVDGQDRGAFAPGQFNMVYLFGIGEIPLSISGDPARTETLVHTFRAVGAVSNALAKLEPGDVIGVRGPYGTPWPIHDNRGKDIVLVAGGIGLAPLRPVMYEIVANREHYNRIYLFYGARTPGDLLYGQELKDWRGRFDLDLNVEVTVDTATADWRGNVGVVTTILHKASFDPSNTVAMICGPEVMMRFTILTLQKYGLRSENIFLSMERNMKCGIGLCGHCQFGKYFICKDGPVFSYDRIEQLLTVREV